VSQLRVLPLLSWRFDKPPILAFFMSGAATSIDQIRRLRSLTLALALGHKTAQAIREYQPSRFRHPFLRCRYFRGSTAVTEPRGQATAVMCRFARASISGSVTAERSALSVVTTRREMSG
jgi:hypothetical protein